MTEPRQPHNTEQRQPEQQPPPEQQPDPHGHAPHGIPHGEADAGPEGRPSSDRQATETVANTAKD